MSRWLIKAYYNEQPFNGKNQIELFCETTENDEKNNFNTSEYFEDFKEGMKDIFNEVIPEFDLKNFKVISDKFEGVPSILIEYEIGEDSKLLNDEQTWNDFLSYFRKNPHLSYLTSNFPNGIWGKNVQLN